ncbi:MAG: 30S ribosomal protein S8 [Deltaproteobacteria bacterium]|nr:30S ribosomal protein S8 [Deltaproteobacteria bacterium]
MPMTDPIADFLARIRNGIMARHDEVIAPSSGTKENIARLLQAEGYISGFSTRPGEKSLNEIVVKLRWPDQTTNAITGLRRRSRPGQRVYVRSTGIPRVRSGLGVAILSTSQGLMTDRAARKAGVGGELLCEVW